MPTPTWLDALNRLWWLDCCGTLPPARVDPVPNARASTLGTPDAPYDERPLRLKPGSKLAFTVTLCTCAKCEASRSR